MLRHLPERDARDVTRCPPYGPPDGSRRPGGGGAHLVARDLDRSRHRVETAGEADERAVAFVANMFNNRGNAPIERAIGLAGSP